MFQSLGINHPKYNKLLRGFARYVTFVVVAVNILMPISVLTGVLK